MKTFYAFMMDEYYSEDSPEGDLARDMECDRDFPKDKSDFDSLMFYFRTRNACADAVEIFISCYREYFGYYKYFEMLKRLDTPHG